MAITAREYTLEDQIFLNDLLGDEKLDFVEPAPTVIQVQKYIGAIKAIERRKDSFLGYMDETSKFYALKVQSCNDQVERLKLLIQDKLNEIKLNSLATPNGTAFLKNSTKIEWPDDNFLVSYCKERHPELVKEKVTETVDKKKLLKLLHDTGEILPGLAEEDVIALQIRG